MCITCKEGFEVRAGTDVWLSRSGMVSRFTAERVVRCNDRTPPMEFVLIGDELYHPHEVHSSKHGALTASLEEIQRQIESTDRAHMQLIDARQRVLAMLGKGVLTEDQFTG